MSAPSPMMTQYGRIKAQHRDAILFFRLGDFYEMFEADATEASEILEIALTKRNGVPMCGVPHHAARGYIARLLQAGRRVAVCEQTSVPTAGGIAEREVVEIVSPGTAVDEELLAGDANSFLVAIGAVGDEIAIAALDVSTSELSATHFAAAASDRLEDELAALVPRELLVQESLVRERADLARVVDQYAPATPIRRFPDWHLDRAVGHQKLVALLGVTNLKAFGLHPEAAELAALALVLTYAESNAMRSLTHIRNITIYDEATHVAVDEAAQRSLELVRNLEDGSSARTLFSVVDHTRTAMGARSLRAQLLRPLRDPVAIRQRLDAVEAVFTSQPGLAALRERLGRVYDLERLASRIALGRANGRDLRAVAQSVGAAAALPELLRERDLQAQLEWIPLRAASDGLLQLAQRIDEAVVDEPPLTIAEGGLIRRGFDAEADRIAGLAENAEGVLASYLQEERARTGIPTLRLGHNRQLGWFFEVGKSRAAAVPEHFHRRQSLTNSERYVTEPLEKMDRDVSAASEHLRNREHEVFLSLRGEAEAHVASLQALGQAIAVVDLLQSLAMAATVGGYTKPVIDDVPGLAIVEGRHPVVESLLPGGGFVPNDIELRPDATLFIMLTGPNMAGKSTYLRQIAQIVLLAHIGSFVPAAAARMGVVDGIYSRVGASDNLARGESTFLVEMNETARILRRASEHSLVILDEIGRGTSTEDGRAIAWAVCEHLLHQSRAMTLFATHFRELSALRHPALANFAMDVVDDEQGVVFLKRIRPGVAEKSYGVHVAALAGVPRTVVERANQLLNSEGLDPPGAGRGEDPLVEGPPAAARYVQESLFATPQFIAEELARLDLEATTPLQAFELLLQWRRQLDGS